MTVDAAAGGWAALLEAGTRTAATLHTSCGRELAIDWERWTATADEADLDVLRRVPGPVLDIGAGPGRMVVAMQQLGIDGMGIDTSAEMIEHARQRAATVVHADVFSAVPSEGRWRTALLLDGNIGIGGDPTRLLIRVTRIVSSDGHLVVETAPPTSRTSGRLARVAHAAGTTEWFPWAVVTADELPAYAEDSGWRTAQRWTRDNRFFTTLVRRRTNRRRPR